MQCSGRTTLVEPFEHQELLITSAIAFGVTADVATSSKNGTIRSGNQHFLFPVHDGLFAVLRMASDDQTVICLHITKRLPNWSLFTPRQVMRVVN
ncbi:hypothetical protein CQS04_13185 [Chryseomicrobium excrementi]|uniref:Uncharacterized protein n=1 Tax=Chryseomicrobium excrementi TaxID=2041346 RepID=A0A2M9EWT0_9BACL|nr:hypothetical protein [Chryseomicrobium excrementi]PJK15648.1 hypothetical protein CQS04_13185 [Chryseomicrobium excrementi]